MTPYDHPEYAGFITAIKASPDDDLPRLVVADWLEEQGEFDRAEFVRVQIEKAGLKCEWEGTPVNCQRYSKACEPCKRFRELVEREEALHLANYSAHLKTMPLISHPTAYPNRIGIYSGNGYVEFVRGFVENVRIRGADWIEHADEILKRNPVRKVTLVGDFLDPRFPLHSRQFAVAVWPGIEFTFEREPVERWQPSEDYNLFTSNAVEAIARRLAVPPHIFRGAE